MKWKIKIKICFGLLLNRRMKRDRDSEKIAWNNSHEYLIALNLVERARDKKRRQHEEEKQIKLLVIKLSWKSHIVCATIIYVYALILNVTIYLYPFVPLQSFFLFLFSLLFCFFFRVWLSIFAHIHGNGNGSKEVCN